MRKYLGILLILAVILAACVPVPAAPDLPVSRGLQPTEVNALRVRQTLDVTGATTLAALAPSSLTVSGATALNGGLTMDTSAFTVADTSGNVATAGTLSVGGGFGSTGCSVSAAGVLQCDGAATIGGAATITGALTANGGIAVDTNAFTVADTSGNTVIAGTLAANGGITVDTSNFTVDGSTGAVSTAASLSALSATLGGGFGAAGCTLAADGALSCDGATILGSTALITGALTANGGIAVDSTAFTVADTSGDTVIAGTLNVAGATIITGSTTFQAAMSVNANGDFDSISVAGNSDLTTINNTGVNPITINDDLTVTGTLTLESAVFSGPVRFGSASTVVTGTTIAHGLATTPTMAVLTAGIPITTPLYITALDAISITVGINDSVSVDTVYWIAGH